MGDMINQSEVARPPHFDDPRGSAQIALKLLTASLRILSRIVESNLFFLASRSTPNRVQMS